MKAAIGSGKIEIRQVDPVRGNIGVRTQRYIPHRHALLNVTQGVPGKLSDKPIGGRSAGGYAALQPNIPARFQRNFDQFVQVLSTGSAAVTSKSATGE